MRRTGLSLLLAAWIWQLPPGFPPPLVPPDNPMSAAKVELGRHLFYDVRLSGNGTYACSTCHRQELAFTDGRDHALGSTGERHPRGALSLVNVAYNASYNWAHPDVRTLEDQALVPMHNASPVEMGVTGHEHEVLDRLRQDPATAERFRSAFPEDVQPVSLGNARRAIASFLRTIVSASSPYDRLLYEDDRTALGASARNGMRLFFSQRLRCAECHGGFTFSGPVVFEGAPGIEPTFHNTGLYDLDGSGSYPPDNLGLRAVTGRTEDTGRFRAPTLRNVALTAPYMHDGSLGTLDAVIDFYAAGGRRIESGPFRGDGRANRYKSERVAGFDLSVEEKRDLVAFLESLTDRTVLTAPQLADPHRPAPAGPAR